MNINTKYKYYKYKSKYNKLINQQYGGKNEYYDKYIVNLKLTDTLETLFHEIKRYSIRQNINLSDFNLYGLDPQITIVDLLISLEKYYEQNKLVDCRKYNMTNPHENNLGMRIAKTHDDNFSYISIASSSYGKINKETFQIQTISFEWDNYGELPTDDSQYDECIDSTMSFIENVLGEFEIKEDNVILTFFSKDKPVLKTGELNGLNFTIKELTEDHFEKAAKLIVGFYGGYKLKQKEQDIIAQLHINKMRQIRYQRDKFLIGIVADDYEVVGFAYIDKAFNIPSEKENEFSQLSLTYCDKICWNREYPGIDKILLNFIMYPTTDLLKRKIDPSFYQRTDYFILDVQPQDKYYEKYAFTDIDDDLKEYILNNNFRNTYQDFDYYFYTSPEINNYVIKTVNLRIELHKLIMYENV